ncbi:helix-turn-helix domain-containing protein [Cohnella sp. GCM10027633]|uniref:helix-turn-helix domain-containing protein n=1 Tax=unclassified Cohnella TaxID=2636738 RepID=UPI0036437F6F
MAYREKAEYAWTETSVRLANTPSAFAKSALPYVQEVGHFEALPAYYTERERLDSYLIVYTVSGEGRLTYGEQTRTLLPGQLFYIDCMNYQHYRAGSDGWELLWVHFNGGAARAYYEQFSDGGGPVLSMGDGAMAPGYIRELIELNRVKSVRNELLSAKLLVELLTEILIAGPLPDAGATPMPAYVKDAIRLMETSYDEKLTLDDMAQRFSVNKHHLAKAFKKHTGFSPGEYVINRRMTRAKELLKYSTLPIAQIAEQIGIDNISHFINLFKDRTGLTPLAFRKSWQLSPR